MTLSPEWRELFEDWRGREEGRTLLQLRRDIMEGNDAAASRRIAESAGFLSALESFDRYILGRIASEKSGSTRPLPKELNVALHNLRRTRSRG
jgi:hypothetical protein